MNISFKVIGLTRLEIKPKSTAPEADALTIWPSELLNKFYKQNGIFVYMTFDPKSRDLKMFIVHVLVTCFGGKRACVLSSKVKKHF